MTNVKQLTRSELIELLTNRDLTIHEMQELRDSQEEIKSVELLGGTRVTVHFYSYGRKTLTLKGE